MSPARKPSGLKTRHDTAADKKAGESREESLRPGRDLPVAAPARLKDHEIASGVWRRIMRMYRGLEAEVVTGMDLDLLIDYCLVTEQVQQLDVMRATAYQAWEKLNEGWEKILIEGDEDKIANATIRLEVAQTEVMKFDARVDQKRKFLFQLRQSMYLTPRARAGAAPAKKEKEEAPDELEQLLDGVTEALNQDRGRGVQ
jgi:phage terminase small subunit